MMNTQAETAIGAKLRFRDEKGMDFPEWVEMRLGEVATWASGGTPPKDVLAYWDGDIPWISASSMRGIEYSDSELKVTVEGVRKGSKWAYQDSLLLLVRGSMLFNKILQ